MAWLDVKKAYDSVPHDWILYCLRKFGVHEKIVTFLKSAMCHWSTALTVNGMFLGKIAIRCGIFQGDSLSPLLFIMSLAPLSLILDQSPKKVIKFLHVSIIWMMLNCMVVHSKK